MIDPHSIKAAIRKVKDLQYTDIEVKVRDATNNDPWGTKSTLMQEIADATHNYEDYPRLFSMLWKRLTDINHVMHVHKALLLIEYLLRNGADRFIRDCKLRAKDIQRLKRYKHYDENSEDDAKDARIKAKRVYELLTDDKLLQEERAKAEKLRGKFTGSSGTSRIKNSSGLQPSVEDRYGSLTPAEMGMEEPKVLAEKAAPGEVDPLDEEDDGGKGGDDDPFGAPAQMTGGDDEERPQPKKKAPKAEKTAQQTVDTEQPKEKKEKKKKKKKKATGESTSPHDDDPFADSPPPQMTSEPKAEPKQTKKAIMAAFEEDEKSSGDTGIDFLSTGSKQPSTQDWAFGDGTSKSKEKSKADTWDPFTDSDKSKPQTKSTTTATSDDPWATDLADLTLGSKGAKPTQQQQSGKSMAAMRGAAPKTIEFTSNPWEDSPFGAQGKKPISPTGFPQGGGGFPPTSGVGYPPSGVVGYQQYPPQGYYQPPPTSGGYGGYPGGVGVGVGVVGGGYGGGFPPTSQQSAFSTFAPPPSTTSSGYDPFASITMSQPQSTIPTSTQQKKQSTAFDGLGW